MMIAGTRGMTKPPPEKIDTPHGTFVFWGSDCVADINECGNTTPGSMCCDSCDHNDTTVPLYVLERPENPVERD